MKIWGPLVPKAKGNTVRQIAKPSPTSIVSVPKELLEAQKKVMLSIDFFYINQKHIFLMMYSENICFTANTHAVSQEVKDYWSFLKEIYSWYSWHLRTHIDHHWYLRPNVLHTNDSQVYRFPRAKMYKSNFHGKQKCTSPFSRQRNCTSPISHHDSFVATHNLLVNNFIMSSFAITSFLHTYTENLSPTTTTTMC